MRAHVHALLFVASSGVCGHALAASSEWVDAQGASLRLVTSGAPDADGRLRGALEIQLKPGWKTYWRDPGSSGVPPSVDLSASLNVSAADVAFPAPKRFPDEFGGWAGYDQSVSLPIVFTTGDPAGPTVLEASVFLGVCETICVPVQAVLNVVPANGADDADDAATVANAFAALPAPADQGFGAVGVAVKEDTLEVEATVPGQADAAELFVASGEGYSLGAPRGEIVDGKLRFSVPLFDKPSEPLQEGRLHYTLTTPSGSVAGVLALP
jgi:DsbC/DsbD-like thiol-disulfide interchange protein